MDHQQTLPACRNPLGGFAILNGSPAFCWSCTRAEGVAIISMRYISLSEPDALYRRLSKRIAQSLIIAERIAEQHQTLTGSPEPSVSIEGVGDSIQLVSDHSSDYRAKRGLHPPF